jgi:hypothetical protein
MPESFRGLRKFLCELMVSRLDNKITTSPRSASKATKDSFFWYFQTSYYYPKTKTNMFVVARTRDGFSVFGIRLGAVVPAWSAGTQVHMDVCGGVPARLDARSPCRHDGCGAVIASCICQLFATGKPLFPCEVWEKACTTMLDSLRGLGKFSKIRNISDSDIPPAKAPRTPSSDKYFFFFFAAVASLREIIRDSVAASPCWALRDRGGEISVLPWLRRKPRCDICEHKHPNDRKES